jgi:Zn-dependent protease with chaperone function
MAKIIIVLGIIIVIIGLILYFFDRIPFLGKLPGDILIKRRNFTFYFPLMTSIIISIIITLILYFISRNR